MIDNPKVHVWVESVKLLSWVLVGSCLIGFLLISGFIIFVPIVAFFIWFFQQGRRKTLKANWKWGAMLLVMSVALSGTMIWGIFRSTRRPDRYLIPQGYVGWVIVEYEVKGTPPLSQEDGYDLYKIPLSGRFQTSSPPEEGMASDEYFYISVKGRQRMTETGWGEGGLIWSGSTSDGSIGVNNNKLSKIVQTPPTQTFFVGTEQQFKKAGPESNSKQMQKIIDSI